MASLTGRAYFSDYPLTHTQPNNFHLLRYILAVLVLLSHCFPLLYGTNEREFVWLFSRGQYTGGSIAVDLFLIISGFLVTQSWLRSGTPGRFLLKRARRVYPGYLVAALLSLLLVWLLDAAGRQYLQSALFMPGFWAQVLALLTIPPIPQFLAQNPYPLHINGSLWTIKYEVGCYLLLAFAGWLGIIRRRSLIVGLFLGCWGVYLVGMLIPAIGFLGWPFRLYEAVRMLTCFLAGVSFYLYRDTIPFSSRLALLSGIAGFLLCVVGVGFAPMLPIFGAYLVFYLAFAPYAPVRSFGQRGDLSYGIYLYAFPVQQVLVHYYQPHLNPLSLFVLAWSVTVLCAWLSWHLVEQPFLRQRA